MSIPEFSYYLLEGRHAFDAERSHFHARMMSRTSPRRNHEPRDGTAPFGNDLPLEEPQQATIEAHRQTFAQRVSARRRERAEESASAAD